MPTWHAAPKAEFEFDPTNYAPWGDFARLLYVYLDVSPSWLSAWWIAEMLGRQSAYLRYGSDEPQLTRYLSTFTPEQRVLLDQVIERGGFFL